MTDRTNGYAYNPLDRQTYEIIAYNAVGRGSEIGTYPAYRLTHSSGYSGWSVGVMQWDFGQKGRREKVDDFLSGYQEWAPADKRFSEAEAASLSERLKTPGQQGNALSKDEQVRINDYLRSDSGRSFVNGLDREQIAYKWENVGQPLSQIQWLQDLSRNDPAQAADIVAMASKRFNQGETRGRELIRHLQDGETTATELSDWIESVSARPPANREALLSGRDGALRAVHLVSSLELGEGRLSRMWREELHEKGNVGLTQGFNYNTTAQLFDGMMRNPSAGAHILAVIDDGDPARSLVIAASRNAQPEMARIELDRAGTLTLRDTKGIEYQMTPEQGWQLADPQPARRAVDEPDCTQPLRAFPHAPVGRGSDRDSLAFTTGDPDLDRLAAALYANDEAAISRVSAHIEKSPQVQSLERWGRDLVAAPQQEMTRQQSSAMGM